MAGGGVHGRVAGTAHVIISLVGVIITAFHLFIERSPRAGGMTTESIIGKGINGTTNAYLITRCNRTGGAGRKTSIGKSNSIGASRIYSHDSPGHS